MVGVRLPDGFGTRPGGVRAGKTLLQTEELTHEGGARQKPQIRLSHLQRGLENSPDVLSHLSVKNHSVSLNAWKTASNRI